MARPLIIEPDFVNRLKRGERLSSACRPCNKCVAAMYTSEAACPDAKRQAGDRA
jgi:2,4-dienoyl-CoA reductase-like NADH-dependent reductase (Old Yellow Enzyme family)